MNIVGFVLRTLKRFGVFLFGIAMIGVAYKTVFPYFQHRTPLLLALALTYVVMAYVCIPFFFRVIRLFWRTDHIPLHTVTPDGFACDPVNLAIIGSRRQLVGAFKKAGWYEADPLTVRNIIRMALSIVFAQTYQNAPFSSLYLFGRAQDIGLQKPVGDNPRRRHHVRFWQVIQPEGDRFVDHVRFWLQHYGTIQPGRNMWVGAATEDIGVAFIRHNAQFTHAIHADTNAERNFIYKELKKTGHVQSKKTLNTTKPYRLKNRVGTTMIADGNVWLIELH